MTMHESSTLARDNPTGRFGTIIYLNGTSSSGKTSVALALQNLLEAPYLHLPIDMFDTLVSRRQVRRGIYPSISALDLGFVHTIAALARTGNNVIVDDVLSEPMEMPDGQTITGRDMLHRRVTVLAPFEVCYVKVYCPLDELERRERARGDRVVGLARFQFERVHRYSQYDLEVNTLHESPTECARRIIDVLEHRPLSSAFSSMHETGADL